MIRYFHGFESIDDLDFEKNDGLIPAIVQDCQTGQVLMMGYMNKESIQKTIDTHYVTFFSRARQKLWTKGEESRHYLNLKAITADCDNDCLLIAADPIGPTCHRGTESCFDGHLPLEASNIAVFNPEAAEVTEGDIAKLLSKFNADSTRENAADLLKGVLGALKQKGISLRDIDALFRQNCDCSHE